MKKALYILFFICFLTDVSDFYAQNLGSRTELFTIENGLSQTGINIIMRDTKGYLWIGTQDGLNRYDGNSFQIFRHQPNDSLTICDNYIRHICEDRNGFIWIATNNGLSKYDPQTGIFVNFFNDPKDNKSILSNSLYYVFADKDGAIWIKTLESLEKFDSNTNTFTHFYHYNNIFNFISGDFYFSILEDDNNRLWIGTKDGLNCFYKDLELFERFESGIAKNTLSNNKIKALCKDKTGNLWIGTDNGLNYFNKKTKSFQQFFNIPGNENSLVGNSVNELFLDSDDILWIGTQNGLCSYNQSTNTFKQFNYTNYRSTKLNLTGISSIVKDNTNILWVGSFQGLVKIDMKPPKFNLLRQNTESEFNSNNINALFVDKNNTIWYSLWEGGLVIQQQSGNKTSYTNQTLPNAFSGKNILAIYADHFNNIWFGTNNGITVFNSNSGYVNLKSLNPDCGFLDNNRVFSLFHDSKDLFWIGTEHGLYTLTNKNNKISNYIAIPDSQGLTFGSVYSITEDSLGFLWFATNKGLRRFDPKTKECKQYVTNYKYNLNSISSNFVYSLLCSSNNTLWVGTSSGLCKYNREKDNFTIFTEKEGLINNFINALLEDKSQTLWISTNRGLSSLNVKTNLFNNYDLADGMQGFEFNQGAACTSVSGDLYFGGTKGINYFNPKNVKVSTTKPNIDISWIELVGKYSYKIPVWPYKTIHIPANMNFFTVSFAVLDFTYPENNQYMYLLTRKGKEGTWINTNSKPNATFSNLPAGEYTLKVKGANSDFIWSDNVYEITIIVDSPLWKSGTATIFYIVILLFGIYVAFQWRTRKLRHSNKILQDKELAASKIAAQKEELTIKNKNITDSINYAKRIQVAMMPSERTFKRLLPNSFVYHKPKDIVSGDFYWLYERNGKVFLAAVDCTGHGVPGAFMSILGVELFRKITQTQTEDPGKILSQLNIDFSRIFSDVEDISLKDGMDISFLVIDKANFSLEFAGAFNPLYIVRENKLIEIKGNRFAVSMEKKQEELNFTTHSMNLQKGDMMYIFSDGYADQFGGYENKKFKYRRLRHLLLNIHTLSLDKQKAYLDESMEAWKGQNEQVDDILIIGISSDFTAPASNVS